MTMGDWATFFNWSQMVFEAGILYALLSLRDRISKPDRVESVQNSRDIVFHFSDLIGKVEDRLTALEKQTPNEIKEDRSLRTGWTNQELDEVLVKNAMIHATNSSAKS